MPISHGREKCNVKSTEMRGSRDVKKKKEKEKVKRQPRTCVHKVLPRILPGSAPAENLVLAAQAELMENKSFDGGSWQRPYLSEYPAGYPPTDDECDSPKSSFDFPKFDVTPSQSPKHTRYNSLEEVRLALAQEGLESCKLIIGIDFSKSNEQRGMSSFNGKSLHHIGNGPNPYEQAISIIGRTFAAFDVDILIPCFGFGDALTEDHEVFSFHPDERYCHGFEEVLDCYRKLVPNLTLAGPTSFAPIIETAMTVVEQNGGQYNALVIIAGGPVTKSVDTEHGQWSPQEQKTILAIVEASKLPLSIVLVGVGDGPWDRMKEFDDNIPARVIKNFHFVNFTEIMAKNVDQTRKEIEFAVSALKEIPSQYQANIMLDMFGEREKANIPKRIALFPPPISGGGSSETSWPNTFDHSSSSYYKQNVQAASAPTSTYEQEVCAICLINPKDMAFSCGHRTCPECGAKIERCPICRAPIAARIRLY